MGTVAGKAIPVLNRVAVMGLSEFPVGFVAGQAEALRFLREEVLMVRAVRLMTWPATVLFHYLVPDGPLEILPVVTLETDLFLHGAKEVIEIRGMGIMAGSTVAGFDRCVSIFSVELQILFTVAGNTERISFILQDQFSHQAVPQMALFTVPLL